MILYVDRSDVVSFQISFFAKEADDVDLIDFILFPFADIERSVNGSLARMRQEESATGDTIMRRVPDAAPTTPSAFLIYAGSAPVEVVHP